MPLAGHTPVPRRWSEHHRPVSKGLQTARCTITRTTSTGSLGEDNVWHPPEPTIVYRGPCRVGSADAASPQTVGDQAVSDTTHTVAIEWDAAEVLEGDIVTINSAVDLGLVGKQLRVTNVRYGSEQWERVLACSDDITRREVRP